MFSHSFEGTSPPPRFDGVPYTRVLVEQSADGITAWTQIADQAIAEDATPESPDPVDITVDTDVERAWFRFRFQTAAGAFSRYSTAVLSPSANPLTLQGLKRRMEREEFDVDDDKLQEYLDAAFLQAQAPAPFGCGRLLTPDPVDPAAVTTRTVPVVRGRALVKDASVLTEVAVNGSAVTGYKTLVKDGYIVQISGLAADATEAVLTGRFGFTAIPGNLADAIYVLAARMSYEEAAMYADNVAILEGDAATVYYRQLPVRTKMVFATYAVAPAVVGLR
jgi:hypothetical protein